MGGRRRENADACKGHMHTSVHLLDYNEFWTSTHSTHGVDIKNCWIQL